MKTILIVEDEENIAHLIADTLQLGGYQFDIAYDGETAVKKVLQNKYALMILDIMLPKLDGFTVMEKLKHKQIPIIFLSAKNDISSIVKGLKEGGQDYMTKPFEPLELLARIELRIGKETEEMFTYKNITVYPQQRQVYKGKDSVALTPKEYDLFLLLYQHIGTVLSRDTLLDTIWNIEADIETRTVDYHIQQLRKKLDLKEEIQTIHKIGYRMEKET